MTTSSNRRRLVPMPTTRRAKKPVPAQHAEPTAARAAVDAVCPKCNGSGVFTAYTGRVVGPCFRCNGSGGARAKPALPDDWLSSPPAVIDHPPPRRVLPDGLRVVLLLAFLVACPFVAVWLAIQWPNPLTVGFAIGAVLTYLAALVRRFPLLGWFLFGLTAGLLGGGRRGRW